MVRDIGVADVGFRFPDGNEFWFSDFAFGRFAGSSCAKASAVVETMAGQAGGHGVL
jgi:hypothetical protein